jgi:hypothetical protein
MTPDFPSYGRLLRLMLVLALLALAQDDRPLPEGGDPAILLHAAALLLGLRYLRLKIAQGKGD